MTLFEHLAELRIRLIICVVAVIVTATVAWFLYDDVVHFMTHPYREYLRHHQQGRQQRQPGHHRPPRGLHDPPEGQRLRGIALASPVLFWELWRFITPGLHKNEKRYVIPFVLGAVVLFATGVTTAILIFPKALDWLIYVERHRGRPPLLARPRTSRLYVAMCLIFGVVFMYPLVVVFLELAGVVPSAKWRKWRRPAIVVICLVAAVITPSSDPFSFLAMAVPMLLFYEGSIIIGRVLHK